MTRTDDFAWAFGRKTYSQFDEFLADFTDYNHRITGIKPPIQDFPLSPSRIRLHFRGVPEGEEDDDELRVTISNQRDAPLSFLEFMFLANNAIYPFLCDADHVFYEGVSEIGEADGIPACWLRLGS